MDRINEQTSAYYTVSFYDKDGALEAPTSVTYSVHDQTDGTVIRTATALTPDSVILVHLDSTDTAMQDETRDYEIHVLTVIGSYGSNDKVTVAIPFQVDNLLGVASV